jgi:hypothetical protein
MADGTSSPVVAAGRRTTDRLRRARNRAGRAARRRLVADLERRVAVLEDEVQECRRLNQRLAEVTDVVEELLLPAGQRDEDALRERLDRFASGL